MKLSEKQTQVLGWIATCMSVAMYVAYIPQIIANLQGNPSQPWQPLFAAVSCLIWVLYGWTKSPKRDFNLIVPNLVGVVLGMLTFLTSF